MKSSRMFAMVVGVVMTVGTVATLQAQEIPACQLGQQLRLALGLGPQEMAALGVSSAAYGTISTAAEQFCQQNRATIEPLLQAAQSASHQAIRAYETSAVDLSANDQATGDALGSLRAACGDLLAGVNTALSTEQRVLWARRAANPLLDIGVGLLELTEQQRSAIQAAQRARDGVLRHHRQRKNLKLCREAHQTFIAALASILTPEQQAESRQLTQTLRANLIGAQMLEESACGG